MSNCFCRRPTGADWKYSRNKFHTNVCSRYCQLTAEKNLAFKVNRTFTVECSACPNTFALKSQYNHANQRFCCQECSRKVLKVKGGRKHYVILTAFYESRTGLTAEDIFTLSLRNTFNIKGRRGAASAIRKWVIRGVLKPEEVGKGMAKSYVWNSDLKPGEVILRYGR